MTTQTERKPAHVIGRTSNRPLGHIAVSSSSRATADFAYEGGMLTLHTWETTSLDPEGARDLAAELLWWADIYMADRGDQGGDHLTDGAEQPDLFEGAS